MATTFERYMDESGRCGRAHARLFMTICAMRDAVNEAKKHDLPPAMEAMMRYLESEARNANAVLKRDAFDAFHVEGYLPPGEPAPKLHPVFAGILAGFGGRQ